jgi:Bifunctional DNA primase/polymerase, N-terminal
MKPYTWAQVEADLQDAIDRGDLENQLRLADLMDHMEPPPGASLAGAAQWYAEQGLPVFPLYPGTKLPYPKTRGMSDASTDRDRIRQWWQWHSASNIGLATGHGVDVIDFDGPEAHAAWTDRYTTSEDRNHPDPDDPALDFARVGVTVLGTVSTPRAGGFHVYVPSTGRGNRAGMLPGVDYRGLGGYVVAPPSHTDDGTYVWLRRLELPS